MIRLLIMPLLLLVSGCPLKTMFNKGVADAPYDIPPTPPIPPETYCYELHRANNGTDFSALQILISGDSVFGTFRSHIGQGNESTGSLTGSIVDSTLLVTYKQAGTGGSEDETWKFTGDSVYQKVMVKIPRDSSEAGLPDSFKITLLPALYKVDCKNRN